MPQLSSLKTIPNLKLLNVPDLSQRSKLKSFRLEQALINQGLFNLNEALLIFEIVITFLLVIVLMLIIMSSIEDTIDFILVMNQWVIIQASLT